MKHTPALGAALCAALLFTPLARAQTDLYVGSNTPANTLDLTNGTNAYANTYVGFTADASNNALGVYNAGTLLTNSTDLYVGRQGSGNTMTVADGAVVAAVTSYMGSFAVSSNNSVLVTGTNSMWQNSSALHVGYSGNGNRLVISNGGTALNFIGSIGAFGSDNIVEVTGAGSLWTNSGELWLGYETNANGNQLVVSNGGTVAADRLLVGYWRGSLSNSLVVTGTNSLLQASNVVVGRAGAGNQLVVSDGGTLASAQYGNLGQNFSSSNNVALVTGAGSLWTSSSAA
jgi:fibronectin-binding autotransporter adhesin